jgi:dUTP pyrophosphatase
MNIKVKKLNEEAVVPSIAKPGDAGMDLTAVSMEIVNEVGYGYVEYGTGLAMEIPEGYYGAIVPRSSISKKGMILANSPGTIDSGYRGEIKLRFKWMHGSEIYSVGDRVAQLIILQCPSVIFNEVDEELLDSSRGSGGFGSTGE